MAAKRGDEAMLEAARRAGGHAPVPVETLPGHEPLGLVAAQLRDLLCVERVSIVVADPDRPGIGRVGACVGAPGLLGERVPVESAAATAVLGAEEAAVLGLTGASAGKASWTFAHVPLDGPGGAAAPHRGRPPDPRLQQRRAAVDRAHRARGAPHFERRRSCRTSA